MKPLNELRYSLGFTPHTMDSAVGYFSDKVEVDYDVYLPSRGVNLQRDFVWTLEQKQELIWSMLYKRLIPPLSLYQTFEDVYKVVDGKQRLSTMIAYYRGEFPIHYEGVDYYMSDLPEEHQKHIRYYHFRYYISFQEVEDDVIQDDLLVSWFKFINFAGTPQDREHLGRLG